VREEVAAMVEDIQLMDKKDTQASKLSGGMKRKLRYNITYKQVGSLRSPPAHLIVVFLALRNPQIRG
jgi:ABC-type lipopolysaccharide export system ATPase subunit